MTKQIIINTLNEFRITHLTWGSQERVIVDGVNLDQIIEPDNYLESELYKWLTINKNKLLAFSWYKDLKEIHAKLHHSYSSLFYVSIRKYNPKTRAQLTKDFRLLETDISQFNDKMLEIEKQLTDMSESEFLDKTLESNAEYRKINTAVETTSVSEESTKLMIEEDQLENQSDTSEYNVAPIKYSHNGDDKDIDEPEEEITLITSTDIEEVIIESSEDNTLDDVDHLGETKNDEDSSYIVDELTSVKSVSDVGTDVDTELKTATLTELQSIDINKFEEKENLISNINHKNDLINDDLIQSDLIDNDQIIDATEVEEANTSSEIVIANKEGASERINPVGSSIDLIEEENDKKPAFNTSVKTNLLKNKSHKQQNILQLKQEKDFIELEFKHLEEKEKLTQKSIDQLHEHLALKKEQIDEELSDNKELLENNLEAKNKIEENLHTMEESKALILNEIADLEKHNTVDQAQSKDDKQTTSIEKQFGLLKSNKNNDLISLEDRLLIKKRDQKALQSKLFSLEEDILEMESQVNNKKNDLADLEEKERVKNEERQKISNNLQDQINKRNEIIEEKLEALNKMSEDIDSTKSEIHNFNIHAEELEKEIELATDNTEITNLEQQKNKKLKNLTETEELKTKKQDEINDLQAQLKIEEKALKELNSDLKDKNTSNEDKVLEAI